MREIPTRKPGDRIFRVRRVQPWRVALRVAPRPRAGPVSPLTLLYGFAGVIAVGTFLLILPISSQSGQVTSPVDALFTATSAVCVTGLVVVDTGTYWSGFGQAVILGLIQIGGFGFMTSATLFLLALGRRIGLRERLLIADSMGLHRLGGLVRLVRRIAVFTVILEGAGALLFYFSFSAHGPPATAVWGSVFQSVSAFNNAGFDILGNFQSLIGYRGDALAVLVTAALVILGGISYLVIADVLTARKLARLSLDTKIVLFTSGSLLAIGMAVALLTEFSNPATLGSVPLPTKFLDAFFQSVTARTAGFTTIDIGQVADYSLFFTILLMFVGGAAGSTAGGIKVNTFGMLIATMGSAIRGRQHARAFGREFVPQQVYRALAVVMLALGMVTLVVLLLTMTEDFRFINLLFESVSAFGTVGLSTGITPDLSTAGRLIIIVTMFAGRLGPLALVLSLIQRQQPATHRHPQEQVRLG